MLSISPPMTGAGRGNYYLSLAEGDYYMAGGEPPGRWCGVASAILDLPPQVEREAFLNLLSGFSPDGRQPLVQNAGSPKRQSGWDLTFSAPKSVSVLWSQAPEAVRKKIEEIHAEAVETAMCCLEEDAGFTRRGPKGRHKARAFIVGAAFEHGTSRAQDPQLHTHIILINLACRHDGSTGTLISQAFFDYKMSAGARYREELSTGLQRALGVQVERTKHGFAIQGVPQSLCRIFSKRRAIILETLKQRGLNSAVAAKVAALDTREKKRHLPRAQLFELWQEVGRQQGWSTPEVERLLARFRRPPRPEATVEQPAGEAPEQPAPGAAQERARVSPEGEARRGTQARGPTGQETRSEQQTAGTSEQRARAASEEESRRAADQFAREQEARRVFEERFRRATERARAASEQRDREQRAREQETRRAAQEEARRAAWQRTRRRSGRAPYGARYSPAKEKSFLGMVIREKWLFPKAPWWSPFRNWKLPYIHVRFLEKGKRYGRIYAQIRLPFRRLQLREKYLFPNAPKWSPFHGLSLPAIVLMRTRPSRRPPPRRRGQTMSY